MSAIPSITPGPIPVKSAPLPVCYNCLMYSGQGPNLDLTPGFPRLQQINAGPPLPLDQSIIDAAVAATSDLFVDFEVWWAGQPPTDADIAALKTSFETIAQKKNPANRFGWYTFSGALNPWAQTYDPTGIAFAERLRKSGLLEHVDFLCADWYYFEETGTPPVPTNPWAVGEVEIWEIRALNIANLAKAAGKPMYLFDCPRVMNPDYANGPAVDLTYWQAKQRFCRALIDRGDLMGACMWDWNSYNPVPASVGPHIAFANQIYSPPRVTQSNDPFRPWPNPHRLVKP